MIVLATLAIAEAGLQRWPITAISQTDMGLRLVMGGMVLLLAAYDLASRRTLQPVTIWAGLYVMVMREALFRLGMTHAWTAVCLWARSHGILSF